MMDRLRFSASLVLSGVLFLAACGQTAPVRNARLELAAEYSQSGQRAYDRGDYLTALRQYEMALQVDVAVENTLGVAIDMLNLARVNQLLGRVEVAHAYLDKLLLDDALEYGNTYLANAATQKALLMLHQGDVNGARSWLEKASAWCVAECLLESVIDNARAAIALREMDGDQAMHWADRAASASRGDSPLEYANALRHMGEAHLMRGEFSAALRLADEALVLDKSLGLPEKIRQDLLLSARAYEGLGDAEQARRFRARAARIISR
ncbi:tetratricopeptide repeat protein [Sideroxyarcus sp. TK5]